MLSSTSIGVCFWQLTILSTVLGLLLQNEKERFFHQDVNLSIPFLMVSPFVQLKFKP